MAWWKQLVVSVIVAAACLVGWIAWMPEARPILERAGIWSALDSSGALRALAAAGITPAGSEDKGAAGSPSAVAGAGRPPGAGGPSQQSDGRQAEAGGRPGQGGGPPGSGAGPQASPQGASAPGGGGGRPGGGGPGGFGGAPTVTVAEVVAAERSATVSAIGTGRALRSVSVSPQAAGRVSEAPVASGQQVRAGDVILRLDDAAERIAVDRARLVLDDARETAERRQRLQGTGAATEVQIRDAELALRTAELALAQAELDLGRRAVTAPIDGYVGLLSIDVGGQVTTTTEITRIDDRSVLLVDFLVPERYVSEIAEGMPLSARPLAATAVPLEGTIRAIDNRVDAVSRSLTVQAEIANPGDRLRAGMAFAIELDFPGETLPSVDALAIQWNRSGAFVWVLREGRAQRVPVRIVQRSGDLVLVEGALEPGEQVVREGVQMLRPGLEVQVRASAATAAGPVNGRAVDATPAGTAPIEG